MVKTDFSLLTNAIILWHTHTHAKARRRQSEKLSTEKRRRSEFGQILLSLYFFVPILRFVAAAAATSLTHRKFTFSDSKNDVANAQAFKLTRKKISGVILDHRHRNYDIHRFRGEAACT